MQQFFPRLPGYAKIHLVLLGMAAAHYFKLFPGTGLPSLLISFFCYGILPGFLLLRTIENENQQSTDVVDLFAKSLFLSIVIFSPLAFLAYLIFFPFWLIFVLYNIVIVILLIAKIRKGNTPNLYQNWLKTFPWGYHAFILFLLLLLSFLWIIGISLKPSDTAEILSGVRKLAENQTISPYSPIIDHPFISHYYGYNSWTLFLAFIARGGNVDVIYLWNYFSGLMLIFMMASVYTFVKILTNNLRPAIFTAILFIFFLFRSGIRGTLISVIDTGLLVGNIVLPSWVTPSLVFMQFSVLALFIKTRNKRLYLVTALGSFCLFSIHGQAILIYALTFSVFFFISIIPFRKDPRFLKALLLLGILTVLINIPYLYVAKMTSQSQYTALVGEGDRIASFWKGYRQYRFLEPLPGNLYMYKVNVFAAYLWIFYIGFFGMPLLYFLVKEEKFLILFVAGVLTPPLFLFNPYFVTYAEQYLTLPQLHRLGAWYPFLKLSFLLLVFLFFEFLGYLFQRLPLKDLHGKALKNIAQMMPFCLLVFMGAYYFNDARHIAKKAYIPRQSPRHWQKIMSSELINVLRSKLPQGSRVFTANQRYFPVTVFSNNYITFSALPHHITSAPIDTAKREYEDGRAVVSSILKGNFRTFFHLIKEYNARYVLLLKKQKNRLVKTKEFKERFRLVANYYKWYLYHVDQ